MRKYLLGMVAVVLAIGFSAFTKESNPKSSTLTAQDFIYNDYPDDTWIGDPAHYTLATSSLSCSGTAHRCGVTAENDGNDHPVLTGATIFRKN